MAQKSKTAMEQSEEPKSKGRSEALKRGARRRRAR
jgi:hypothetical protein